MDTLRRLTLGQPHKPSKYPRVPTDRVVPVHYFDDTPLLRRSVNCWTLRFNDRLDADKLRAALAQVLNCDGWRKLGGRVRLNVRKSYLGDIVGSRSFSNNTLTGPIGVGDTYPRGIYCRAPSAKLLSSFFRY